MDETLEEFEQIIQDASKNGGNVGYQAIGTPGRALVDGAKVFRLGGDKITVNATIHTLGCFSAHASQSQLIDWISHSPSYRLAYADEEFLLRDELRPVQLQLELLKPDLLQQEKGIH